MGKFDLKKFLSNKNTVTVLAVILGVIVLYFAYNSRVKQAIQPKSVPIASKKLTASTVISAEMIEYVEVTNDLVKKSPNLITNANQLIGKKIAAGSTISKGGLFYTSQIATADDANDNDFANIPDGYTIFELGVDFDSTYGNSIYPGNYIDLYFKTTYNGKLLYGKFIESIEVLDVRDSSGRHVFDGGDSTGTPAVLLFAVPDDMHLLLNKAKLMPSSNVKILPVPRNASYSANPGETKIASSFIENIILSNSAVIPEE